MKRPLQLSLAIALAFGATNAFALGLGVIQVQSGLNQPLVAEIPIIQSEPGEAEGLIVQLATAEDFERVGMNRSTIGVPIEFSLTKNARGEPVVRITSKEIVREPFIGMLLEANWPKGRLLREYTILLDPPVMAPAIKGSSAIAVAAKEPAPTATQALPTSKPSAPAAPATVASAKPPMAAPKTPPASSPAPRAAGGNEYGPVAAGETLGEIARATRTDEAVTVNQMMIALLKNNPGAFFKENINALKRGAVLRIPSSEEIAANGSAREAAAAVRAQIDEWRGSVSSSPTLVADTSRPSTSVSTPSSSSRSSGERLALVPPREGKAGQESADRPSGGRAGGTGDAASKAELARVREALTSKEQESSELKSRVKDLEDIKGKNEKMINLQSTELAELREKLKQLQEAEKKAAASASVKIPAAEPTPSVIVATAPAPTASVKADATTADAKITKDDIWGDAAPKPANPPADAADSGSITTPASADATAADTAPAVVAEPPKPAPPKVVEPKKPVVKPMPKPVEPVASTPWYLEPWVLGAAGVAGLLLVVLGIFGLRKRKPAATASRPSIANAFGDSPIGGKVSSDSEMDAEEQELIAQVQADPSNPNSHLELLSLYYAQGAAEKFEAAAEEMYAYVADPNQSSWREVRTMGEELVPNNPLFSQQNSLVDDYPADGKTEAYRFDEPDPSDSADFPDFADLDEDEPDLAHTSRTAAENLETASMPAFDASGFDLGETSPPAPTPAPSSDTSFSFDLPPIQEAPSVSEPDVLPEPAPLPEFEMDDDKSTVEVPAAEISDDEFFAGEDAIGTKLDLAKAYLDMGDPDGARSMLEEVLAEGGPSQQDEARKLIAEIG
jgi:pilus assembly protein FimV